MYFVGLTSSENKIKDRVLERLKEAREVEKQTFEAIADKARTVKNHIHDIYKGKKSLTLSMALKIWEGLGENISDLIGEDADPLLKRLATMSEEKREVLAKLIDLIEPERDLPPSIISLTQLIESLHYERFQEPPPQGEPHKK